MTVSLRREFGVAVSAGEAAIRIDTDEIEDAIKTLTEVSIKYGWELRVWDKTSGVRFYTAQKTAKKPVPVKKDALSSGGMNEMLAAIGGPPGGGSGGSPAIAELVNFLHEPPQPDLANKGEVRPVILCIKNFNLIFENGRQDVSSCIQNIVSNKVGDHPQYQDLKKEFDGHGISGDSDTGKFIVGIMPPQSKLPAEIEPLFKRIDHELPNEEEIGYILEGILPSADEKGKDEDNDHGALTEEDRRKVCKFALGLTRLQAEGVFSACLVQHERIVPQYVWEQKSRILNKEGLVELYQGKETFADVAGLDGAKDIMSRLLTPDEIDDADPRFRAKGALFCGPPGVGKSLIAKAAGNEFNLPTLMVHPGNWMGSLVGESEAKTRKGFQILRAHAPCIAIVDEVEKVMPRSRGHQGDSGVGARMEGTFLTMMNDIQESVFWVFTANDVRNMHEAFFRAERVDAVFYVPLPGPGQRMALWRQYLRAAYPEEVMVGKEKIKFPRYISLKFTEHLEALSKAKKVQPLEWAEKIVPAIMCMPAEKREEAVAKVKQVNETVAQSLKLVADEGWSPAEIKACCRLARRMKESISITQDRIRPVAISAKKQIEALEEWAAESALDAQTGKLYQPVIETEDGVVDTRVKYKPKTSVRRRVRKLEE